jgi:hypothetical protein
MPLITASIALLGGPGTVISRSSVTAFRILDIAAGGALRVSNAAIQNGSTAGLGGGIQNAGTLHLKQVLLSGNSAANGGGMANISGGTANIHHTVLDRNTTTGVGGGGIINSGTMTLLGSSLSGNTAPINGGGLNTQASGKADIVNSAFDHNVSGGLGGAISNLGSTSLTVSVVQFNTGSAGGGERHREQQRHPARVARHEEQPGQLQPAQRDPGLPRLPRPRGRVSPGQALRA